MKAPNYSPVYCALYPELSEIVRQHGYALAIHGSLARDFDLICIPWVKNCSNPEDVVKQLTETFALKVSSDGYENKYHGRIAYALTIGFGECFIDLSFMPVTESN